MPNLDPKRGREILIDCRGDEYVLYDAADGYNLGAAFTALCWFKIPTGESIANGANIYGGYFGAVASNEWALRTLTDGALRLEVGTGDAASATGVISVDNEWHWIAAVYDGGQAADDDKGRIYLDGALIATTPLGTWPTTLAASTDISLGADNTGAGDYTNMLYRSAMTVKGAMTLQQLNIAANLLQARNPLYAQQEIVKMLGAEASDVIHHVQPTWNGSLTVADAATVLRDLGPAARVCTPSADIVLAQKDRAELVAGQV